MPIVSDLNHAMRVTATHADYTFALTADVSESSLSRSCTSWSSAPIGMPGAVRRVCEHSGHFRCCVGVLLQVSSRSGVEIGTVLGWLRACW